MDQSGLPPEWFARANRLAIVTALLSTTVHEVNNALQVISGSAELLAPGATSDVVARRSDAIGSQARRASALLAELSAFARDDTPEIERADLGQIARRALAMRQYTLARLNIQSGFEGDGAVRMAAARPRMVLQIVLNLLLNAERALTGRVGGRIVVHMAPGGECADLTVEDNGPGIPAPLASQLFTPSPARTEGPLGIGLSVSRWLAERAGGSLELSTSSLGGCAIRLRLRPAS